MHIKMWTDNCVDTGGHLHQDPGSAHTRLGCARLGSARLGSAQTGRGLLHLYRLLSFYGPTINMSLQSKSELWCHHRSKHVPCPQYFQSETSWWRAIEREPCSALLQSGVESDFQLSQGIRAYHTMSRASPNMAPAFSLMLVVPLCDTRCTEL